MKTDRPLIGIVALTRQDGENPSFHAVRRTYIESIVEAGGAPLLIPLISFHEHALRHAFDSVHGLLFCGGADICPSHYEEQPLEHSDKPDEDRDSTELMLMRWAIEELKPVLGVCRGCQLMNVAAGGTLHQDIPTTLPSAVVHKDRFLTDYKAQLAMRHLVEFGASSKVEAIHNKTKLKVNTIHHQAVKEVGRGFLASGKSEDGVIEAIEHEKHPFAVGVQWHPEILWKSEDRIHLRPFEELVLQARGR